MKFIRIILGFFVRHIDRLTAPTPIEHEAQIQAQLDLKTETFTLYHLETCPFCVKVRREIRRLNLKVKFKEIAQDPVALQELLAGGKLDQAPCLRIEGPTGTQWMYESSVINEFLRSLVPGQKSAS